MEAPQARVEAAYHEAGHAVAAETLWVVGLPTRRVQSVVLSFAGTGVTILEPLQGPLTGVAERAAVIVFTLAGPLAQSRFRGEPQAHWVACERLGGSEGDVALARRLAEGLACGSRWRDAWLRHLFEETLLLSRDPAFWPCVDAVADRLDRDGALSGDVVRRLVRDVGAPLRSHEEGRERHASLAAVDDVVGGRVPLPAAGRAGRRRT